MAFQKLSFLILKIAPIEPRINSTTNFKMIEDIKETKIVFINLPIKLII